MVDIGFTGLDSGILDATSPNYITATASKVSALLAADAKSATDTFAVASLKKLSPKSSIALTRVQAMALSLSAMGSDGTVGFSTNYTFATSRDPDGMIASDAFDLIGVAEHEIAHLLGFGSSIDGGTPNRMPTLLEQFRFSAPNTRATVAGAAYFSLDDGPSAVLDPLGSSADFSPGGASEYQAS